MIKIKLNNGNDIEVNNLYSKGTYFIHHPIVRDVDGKPFVSSIPYLKELNKEETITCNRHYFNKQYKAYYTISNIDSSLRVVSLSNLRLAKKLVRLLDYSDKVRFWFNLDIEDKEVLEALRQEILRFFKYNNYTNFKLNGEVK